VGFGNLGNSPLFPTIFKSELEFLGIVFGKLGIIVMGGFHGGAKLVKLRLN
jgi:hypothetical protein